MLLLLLALVSGCCGYGGPGCGRPWLVGLCAGQVPLGESTATVSFDDDGGIHPSRYAWVDASPVGFLRASPGQDLGEVVLEAFAPGSASIQVGGAEGWDSDVVFGYSVKVVTEVVEDACAGDVELLLAPDAPGER